MEGPLSMGPTPSSLKTFNHINFKIMISGYCWNLHLPQLVECWMRSWQILSWWPAPLVRRWGQSWTVGPRCFLAAVLSQCRWCCREGDKKKGQCRPTGPTRSWVCCLSSGIFLCSSLQPRNTWILVWTRWRGQSCNWRTRQRLNSSTSTVHIKPLLKWWTC